VARQRFNVERIIGIVVQGCPDLLNAFIHALFKVNEGFHTPQFFLDFLPGHDLAGVAGQQSQQFERQGRQLDRRSAFTQFFGGEI